MSDTTFINTYVNLTVETVHSYLNDILQLKTQVKILNDQVSEKDQVITGLQSEKDSLLDERNRLNDEKNRVDEIHHADESEMNKLRENAAVWEHQYNTMVNKVSHMDTLTNQYTDLKRSYVEKTQELEKVTQELEKVNLELQTLKTVNEDLELANKKIEKLMKKEEKKPSSKVVINKEESKSSFTPTKSISVKDTKEIDDDF